MTCESLSFLTYALTTLSKWLLFALSLRILSCLDTVYEVVSNTSSLGVARIYITGTLSLCIIGTREVGGSVTKQDYYL